MFKLAPPFKQTRAVLVFATECKNNVEPHLRSQKVNYIQLFFALIILEFSHADDIIKPHTVYR